jgi:hypothetical protein
LDAPRFAVKGDLIRQLELSASLSFYLAVDLYFTILYAPGRLKSILN